MVVTRRAHLADARKLRSRTLKFALSTGLDSFPLRSRRTNAARSTSIPHLSTPTFYPQAHTTEQHTTSVPSVDGEPDLDPADVGAPKDSKYEVVDALSQRSYPLHGTNQLLSYKERWLTPDAFNVDRARERLEAMLQTQTGQEQCPPKSAECTFPDWFHIDSPTAYRLISGKGYFLTRWKHVWTPQADIVGLYALLPAYHKRQEGRRTSSRTRTFDSEKWEGFMRVVNLDSYLEH